MLLAKLCTAAPGRSHRLRAVLILALAPSAVHGALRVNGSTTVNPVVSDAAELLRAERGMVIRVDALGGSAGGISALAEGRADVAMSSRPIGADDRARFPGIDFRAVAIGTDAVALVVSRDVWEGGVRALSRDQVRALYEGRVQDWRELGGSDRRVVFFNKEPGRGTWEVFADWLYGDAAQAPFVPWPEVGSNEEGRSKVASTPGAVTQLSAAWADGARTFAIALRTGNGATVAPTGGEIAAGRYPLARLLLVVTDGPPGPEAELLIALLLSPRGQALVERHGYLPVAHPADEGARK